jgi:succinoglycan biosynthesis transport protein ExoP
VRPQDFWQLYRAVYRRRWLVAALVCGTLAVVGTACLLMPRYYRAAAFVMPSQYALSKPVIPGTGASLTPPNAARQSDVRREQEQLATLIGLAKTSEVRKRAIQSLGLGMTPSQLETLVSAEPGEGSIIRISALARTSEGAVSLANALAHQFAEYYQDLAGYQARQNLKFLEGALTDAETKLETARTNLQALKGKQGEAALPVGSSENPFLSQFYSLRAEIDETSSRLREVEGRLGAIREELAQQTPTKQTETRTTDNPVTRSMLDDLARLERDLLVAQTRYTDKHRKVVDLKAQIADLKARIEREGGTMVTQRTVTANPVYERLREQIVELRTEKEALNAKLASLSKSMTENERRAGRLADSSVALVAKSVEYDNAQARYNQVKELLDAARLEERLSSRSGELQVVDEAKSAAGPVTKSGPSVVQLLVLGIALSLFLGVGTAVMLAFLDTRIFERGDLQRGLDLPVATVVPALIGGTPSGSSLARITELQPLSAHAEAYRYLRAQLLYRNGQSPMRTLLIATARPGQGGSTTAVNLALSLAEVDERVVLIDADLRRPSLHRVFGQDNDAGLTTVLSNGGDASRALRQTTVPNMLLLPAGPPAPNPAALLTSARMRQLLGQLRAHCDYVIIDTPSAGAFADAVMMAPLVDGVILVSRANQSLRETEQHIKELLRTVGANVIGAVLNDAPTERVDSYRFHTHYYGHAAALPAPGNGHSEVTVIAPGEEAPRGTRPPIPQVRRRGHRGLIVLALAVLCAAVGGLSYHFGVGGAARRHPAAAPAAQPAALAVTVTAVVAEPTTVRVERDGALLYEGPLTAGQQIWQGAKEVTVWAERPEALELTVNGRAMGRMGAPGDPPVSRRFTPDEN